MQCRTCSPRRRSLRTSTASPVWKVLISAASVAATRVPLTILRLWADGPCRRTHSSTQQPQQRRYRPPCRVARWRHPHPHPLHPRPLRLSTPPRRRTRAQERRQAPNQHPPHSHHHNHHRPCQHPRSQHAKRTPCMRIRFFFLPSSRLLCAALCFFPLQWCSLP
jgi:hypothetical protein